MRYKAPRRLLLLHSRFLLVNMAFEGRRIRVRLSLGVEFDSQAAKSAFSSRLEYIRSLLTPPGLRSLDNHGLLSALFDLVEGSVPSSFPGVTRAPASHLPALQQILPPLVSPLTDQLLCNLSTPMQVSANLHTCKYHSRI